MESNLQTLPSGFVEYVEHQRILRVYAEVSPDFFDHIDLLSLLYPKIGFEDYNLLKKALEFSMSIEYTHPGLSSKSYLRHPIRVTKLIAQNLDKFSIHTLVIALLHNIIETSNIAFNTIETNFGFFVADSIKKLTVDRSNTTELYKKKYYENLIKQGEETCIVKIFDKFDNLFMLSTNPNKDIRDAYIGEIRRYLMPIVKQYTPVLSEHFNHMCYHTYSKPHTNKQHYLDLVLSGKIVI